jgi:hypothetical protein
MALKTGSTAREESPEDVVSFDGESIIAYPNPSDDELIIEISEPVDAVTPVRIFNQFGQTVFGSSIGAGQTRVSVKTKDLPEGMYILQMKYLNTLTLRKVIVVH